MTRSGAGQEAESSKLELNRVEQLGEIRLNFESFKSSFFSPSRFSPSTRQCTFDCTDIICRLYGLNQAGGQRSAGRLGGDRKNGNADLEVDFMSDQAKGR